MKHILVIRLSALGDVALMAPLVHDYAVSNPHLRFTVAGPPLLQPLFAGIDNVEYLGLKKRQSFIKLYKILNAVGADTVVDLHKVNRVGFALTLLRLRHLFNFHFRLCALRKGKITRWLYLHHLYRRPRKPQFQRYDETFRRAGLSRTATTPPRHAAVQPPTIGLAPFSQHPGKIWPWEYTCDLARRLAERGYQVLLFGSKDEAPQLETLAAAHDNIRCLAGKQTFAEELEIIKTLTLMVSMDSANMHFAAALGVTVVSIWGATHPDFGYYPPRLRRADALCAGLRCQPCSAFGQKACRYSDYRCLRAITPDMVFKKIEETLPGSVTKG